MRTKKEIISRINQLQSANKKLQYELINTTFMSTADPRRLELFLKYNDNLRQIRLLEWVLDEN